MISQVYYFLKDWFLKYADSFLERSDADIENLLLKKEHTLRVCEEMDKLTTGEVEKIQLLSRIAALLHDIGRFEQLTRYGTFADFRSEDHADLGVKIIKQKALLSRMLPRERQLILDSVGNHNKVELNAGLSGETRHVACFLRDADKLDIWRVVIGYYQTGREKENPSLVHNFPPGTDVSPAVYQAVLSGKTVSYEMIESVIDMKVLQMGWVHDLNSQRALELVRDREYLEGIYTTIPPSAKGEHLYFSMKESLYSMLRGECYV